MKLKLEHYLLLGIAAVTMLSLYCCWKSPVARAIRNGQNINALVIGTDLVDNARHSDTMVFLNYAPDTSFLNIIAIPRDTHYSPPGYLFHRINEVYTYHFRKKKNEHAACFEVLSAVEGLLQCRAPIPYYVQIDYESFRRIIDMIGGITIDIEEPMHYDDNAGNLHIHFEPGPRHLNGREALEYVRFRGANGDIGREYRQQRFLKAVLSRFKNPLILVRLPWIVRMVAADIKTNLTIGDILAGLMELKDLRSSNIRLAQLPGAPNGPYWEMDAENCAGLFDKIFPSTGTVVADGPRIRVEVWNASGKNRLADRVTWLLRKQGYDVVKWGSLSTLQKKTLIKDLTGNLRSAQKIAEVISCGEVITRYDGKKLIDISVILGEDCNVPDDGTRRKLTSDGRGL